MVHPESSSYFTLRDLKKCHSAPLFFDMIFDLRKYDAHVRKIDPQFREQDEVWIWNTVSGNIHCNTTITGSSHHHSLHSGNGSGKIKLE